MVTPVARREAVVHLRQRFGVSQRRACRAIGADRSTILYRRRRADDGAVRARLRELAAGGALEAAPREPLHREQTRQQQQILWGDFATLVNRHHIHSRDDDAAEKPGPYKVVTDGHPRGATTLTLPAADRPGPGLSLCFAGGAVHSRVTAVMHFPPQDIGR